MSTVKKRQPIWFHSVAVNTPDCLSGSKGSNPFETVHIFNIGIVAQLGEHLPCKQGVESSSLFGSTIPT